MNQPENPSSFGGFHTVDIGDLKEPQTAEKYDRNSQTPDWERSDRPGSPMTNRVDPNIPTKLIEMTGVQ
jgi:hypothetical protein